MNASLKLGAVAKPERPSAQARGEPRGKTCGPHPLRALDFLHFGSTDLLTPQTEFRSVTTRSFSLLYVFRSRLIVAATLLLTFAATPTSGSPPQSGTRTGQGNDGTASGSSSALLATGTTPTFAWPASVSAEERRFLDQTDEVRPN